MTGRFSGIDVAEDGTIFVDQQNNTLQILKINASDGSVEHVAKAKTYLLRSHTVELPDGRVIVPGVVSGRPRLMLSETDKLATPLIDTSEETSGPITVVGKDLIAFLFGSDCGKVHRPRLAAGSSHHSHDPRAGRGFNCSAGGFRRRQPLYYIRENTVWQVSVAGGEPRRIAAANSLAVDPNGREIILQRVGPNLAVRLFRMAVDGGREEEIAIGASVRISETFLAANAINKEGKILLTTALDANTWYWQVSICDPKTGMASTSPPISPATSCTQAGRLTAKSSRRA